MTFFQHGEQFTSIQIGKQSCHDNGPCGNKKSAVLMLANTAACNRKQYRSEKPARRRDAQEDPGSYMAHTYDVTQGIFWKSGNKEKGKRNSDTLVFHEVVIFLYDLWPDNFFSQRQPV